MDTALDTALQDLWQHITSDRQAWLFGAGISFGAGIPLMYPLTEYVQKLLEEQKFAHLDVLKAIRSELPEDSHIEHVLSQIGDFVALADRSKTKSITIDKKKVEIKALKELHSGILDQIGYAIRYGYRPASGDNLEIRGTAEKPIVRVDDHLNFVRRLFKARLKPGVGQSPITFFTANYDTLLEDALALGKFNYVDGFLGGAMAYWAPEQSYDRSNLIKAKVVKLHGSIDWHLLEDGNLVRCRAACDYPNKTNNLLIYPQSTKYIATQKDPFASLFLQLRETLARTPDNVLGICGYSFGDEHINGEIEAAMANPTSKTIIVAFSEERSVNGTVQLPETLQDWLSTRHWKERVFVASSRGLYHGNLNNLLPNGASYSWWTFTGLAKYLVEEREMLFPAASKAPTPSIQKAAPKEVA